MRRSYWIGGLEKHRLDFRINWLTGLLTVSCDGKVLFRKPFFFKIDQSFEVGEKRKHIVSIRFNLFDYFQDVFHIQIDGQVPGPGVEIKDREDRPENPADDAAAALLFVVCINVIFSVIGTLFVPQLDSLSVRLTLLLGALIYLLFAVKTMLGQRNGLLLGTIVFLVDSVYQMKIGPSVGGLIVRGVIFFYLVLGLAYLFQKRKMGLRK